MVAAILVWFAVPEPARAVERDLGGVNLERKTNAQLLVVIQNRRPSLGEVFESVVDHFLRRRRERIQERPHRASGEADNGVDAEVLRSRALSKGQVEIGAL